MTAHKRLDIWEEACGRLHGVAEDYPYLTLDFGRFHVMIVPEEANKIKGQLEEMIGKKISVLRTDLPDKPILVREHLNHEPS
jgi:hypothetical protein